MALKFGDRCPECHYKVPYYSPKWYSVALALSIVGVGLAGVVAGALMVVL